MKHIIGSYNELKNKKKLRVIVHNTPYLVALIHEAAYMIPDTCPHQDASLYEGKLEGTCITCPLHKATFDMVTGEIDDVSKMLYFDFGPEKITTYKLMIDGDSLVVEL
jgi:nitrite reductase/ring-hydroxylating ferredoxin subunit